MTGEIYAKMAAILADCDAIEKKRTNSHQGFKFRGIDDAMNALHDTFAKHQVFVTHDLLDHQMIERETKSGGKSFHHISKVRFTFWAPDSSSVSAVGIGEAADTGDKGAGKSMAYALKVCLLQTFLIPTEEEKDPDQRIVEFAPKPAAVMKMAAPKAIAPITSLEAPREPISETGSPQVYEDNDTCKKWLAREAMAYNVTPRLEHFVDILKYLHKLCVGKPLEKCQSLISLELLQKGFKL